MDELNCNFFLRNVWWWSYLQSRNHTKPHNVIYANNTTDDNHCSLKKYIPIRADMIVHNKWKRVVEEYGNVNNRTEEDRKELCCGGMEFLK